MAAIVQYKRSKIICIIPVSWIYEFDIRDKLEYTKSYVSFYHESTSQTAPEIPGETSTMVPGAQLNNQFYKVYIKSVHGKHFHSKINQQSKL